MFRYLIPAILVLMAAAQQGVVANRVPPGLRISGIVVNAANGTPLKDIEVAIGPVSSSGGQKTKTDAQGRFVFERLAKGKFWLAAQGRGFPRQTYDEHETYSSAIVVGSDVPSEGIVFRLRPGAAISGMITDELNEPIRNATVAVFRTGIFNGRQATSPPRYTNSDDRGRYRFSPLYGGSYLIAVSAQPWYAQSGPRFQTVTATTTRADGSTRTIRKEVTEPQNPLDMAYPLTFYPSTTDVSSATPIVVKPGEQASADVTLTAVPAVHLRIPASSQTQNTNFMLSQHVFGSSIQLPQQTFRNDGEVEITGIPPGQFTLDGQAMGPSPAKSSQQISILENGEIAKTESLPFITVHGVVAMEGNSLYRDVFVYLRNENGIYTGQVSEKGEFQMSEPIHAGRYEVLVDGIAGGVIVGSVTRDALPPVEGNRIELDGSGPTQLTVKMARGLGGVEGLAVKNGKPFPGAMIVLVPDDIGRKASLVRRDQSDSDGTFLLARALPGRYKIVAIENGWTMEWSNPEVIKPYLKAAEPIEITAHQKSTVTVTVQ